MIDEIARLLQAGGKRLRPAFCFWGYRACRGHGTTNCAVRAASSLELLHTFAIVHDDIMDSSDERRGLPTTFAVHGVNVALLVGDLALVLADHAFMRSGFPARSRDPRLRHLLAHAARGDRRPVPRRGHLRRVGRLCGGGRAGSRSLKSGRYSIEEPLLIGASLAGAPEELMKGLAKFGAPLGEAFQLRDDLLGTFGDRSSIGKPVDSDIREGKRHVLYAKTIELLGEDAAGFRRPLGRGGRAVRRRCRRAQGGHRSFGGESGDREAPGGAPGRGDGMPSPTSRSTRGASCRPWSELASPGDRTPGLAALE